MSKEQFELNKPKSGFELEQQYEIKLSKIKVFGHHGVNEEETKNGQFFYIDACLRVNKNPEKLEDNIASTVSYAHINKLIIKIVSENVYKLIETLATEIANKILEIFPDISYVKISVSKPHAPMKGCFEDVSVSVIRYSKNKQSIVKLNNKLNNNVFLSLGSNIGIRKNNLDLAIFHIKNLENTEVVEISDFYETKPVGFEEQNDFLNCCLNLKTDLGVFELLTQMQKIEKQMGRTKNIRFGPRIIDIDILFFNNLSFQDENLVVPHQRMFERAFVLVPLLEILPKNNFYFEKTKKSLNLLPKSELVGVKKHHNNNIL